MKHHPLALQREDENGVQALADNVFISWSTHVLHDKGLANDVFVPVAL